VNATNQKAILQLHSCSDKANHVLNNYDVYAYTSFCLGWLL